MSNKLIFSFKSKCGAEYSMPLNLSTNINAQTKIKGKMSGIKPDGCIIDVFSNCDDVSLLPKWTGIQYHAPQNKIKLNYEGDEYVYKIDASLHNDKFGRQGKCSYVLSAKCIYIK